MGQNSVLNPIKVTPQLIQQSIKVLFGDKDKQFQPNQISTPIRALLQELACKDLFSTLQGNLTQVNQTIISIAYQANFAVSMLKIVNIFCDSLEKIMTCKAFVFVKRQQWNFVRNLGCFLTVFSDERLLNYLENLSVRSDLTQNTQNILKKLKKQQGEFQLQGLLITKIGGSQLQRIQRCLRISLNYMVKLHQQIFARSEYTISIIKMLEKVCFILYLKVYFSPENHHIIKRSRSEHINTNLTIGLYFLQLGTSQSIPSIFQSAVIFLYSLIDKNPELPKHLKPLASHIFPNLPLISNQDLYQYIICTTFYALTFIVLKQQSYIKFVCNRIMALKMCNCLISQKKVTSKQIKFYLEQLCFQVKVGQIERAFLSELACTYLEACSEKSIKLEPGIINKFKQQGIKFAYNLNFPEKKYKITTEQVLTELQNDENTFQREFKLYAEKFIYEVVLGKPVSTKFEDHEIWNQILPQWIENKQQSKAQQLNQTP